MIVSWQSCLCEYRVFVIVSCERESGPEDNFLTSIAEKAFVPQPFLPQRYMGLLPVPNGGFPLMYPAHRACHDQ